MDTTRNGADATGRAEIVGRLWHFAYRAAQSLGARREDAEDIASAAIERYLDAPAEISSPESWARVVVRRRWCRLVLRRRRQVTFGPQHDSHAALEVDWRPRELLSVARLLKVRDRRLLLLAASGVAHAEIGQMLGLRQSAVGAYLVRVIQRARRLAMGVATASLPA